MPWGCPACHGLSRVPWGCLAGLGVVLCAMGSSHALWGRSACCGSSHALWGCPACCGIIQRILESSRPSHVPWGHLSRTVLSFLPSCCSCCPPSVGQLSVGGGEGRQEMGEREK